MQELSRLWQQNGCFCPLYRLCKTKPYSLSARTDADDDIVLRKSIRYCLDIVKKHDYDHYLCNLLLPRDVHAAAFAVRALNVEVAHIHDVVTEKQTGLMRIQFWRDLLDSVYKGQPPQQPVALALANILKHRKLSKHWFTRLLDAREAELSVAAYLSTEKMEAYAENTYSSLLYLTLEAAGVRDVHADHAASHLGKAEGIVILLRSVAYFRSRRRVLIPMDILLRHGVSQEDVLRGEKASQELKDAVFDFASLANAHLSKARSLEKHLTREAKKALLPSVVCESFLKRIQLADFDPFAASLFQRDSKMPLQLLWRTIRKTY